MAGNLANERSSVLTFKVLPQAGQMMVSARFPDVNQLLYLFIPMTGFQCCQSPSSHSYVEGQEV